MRLGFKYFLSVYLLLCTIQVTLGQKVDEVDGEVQDAQIVIEKERKIELNPERKIYEFIKWQPEKKEINLAPSNYQWYNFETSVDNLRPESASIPVANESKAYEHYAKAGFGNYGSPLLNVNLTKDFDKGRNVGFNLMHESFARGEVDTDNSSSAATEANLFGALDQEKFRLESTLSYRLENNLYYGYPEGTVVDRDDLDHKSNFLDLSLRVKDRQMSDAWNYYGALGIQRYTDNFSARESTFMGGGTLGYSDSFFLDGSFALSKYKDVGIDESRSFVRINPYYRLAIDDLTMDVGLSLSFQNDNFPELNTSKVFPYVQASYSINNSYEAFAKLDGGFEFNTLYEFAEKTGVLNQSIGVVNSENLIDFSAGIKGRPLDQLSFVARAGFQSVKFLPILINNGTDQSRLDVIYDVENSKILSIGLEANYLLNQSHVLVLGINLFNYSSEGYDQIYHRPTSEFLISGRHKLMPQLSARWDFSLYGGLMAPGLQATDADISLKTIAKLDLELNYQINNQWGVFVLGQNLANQAYERYLHYLQRGIQVKAGATFRL